MRIMNKETVHMCDFNIFFLFESSVNGFGTFCIREVVLCVTNCDGWGGAGGGRGQENQKKRGRRLWTALSKSQRELQKSGIGYC